MYYAEKIVSQTSFKKVFAFGCSGNQKHYFIRPIYVDQKGYKLLPMVRNFEYFSKNNIEKYYKEQVLGEISIETAELEVVLKKSADLHEALRNYGQLGDTEKPLVVSAILLTLSNDDFKASLLTGSKTNTDGEKIFAAIKDYMTQLEVTPQTKKEQVLNQFNIIKDRKLLNDIDERLGKTAICFFTEFINTHILNSLKENAKEDILGRFYGEFISYSGGDGQSLGVVLTPAHIARFAVSVHLISRI